MFRFVSLVILALIPLAAAQQPTTTSPAVRPVLRALPLANEVPTPAPASPAVLVKPALTINPVIPIPALSLPSPLEVKPTGDDAIRLQIFLDDARFGPGIIDGKPGRFTELAVQSWNEVNGHPLTDWIAVNTAARKKVQNPLAVALVPDCVVAWVDASLPTKVSHQARRKRMSYRGVAEFMAERYHCDVEFLALINPNLKIHSLKPRDSLVVPNVSPFTIESLTGLGYKSDEVMSQRHAVVDTKVNQVRIFEGAPPARIVAEPGSLSSNTIVPNRGLIASFPITPGENRFIKFGTWEVRNSVELPHWRYDQKLLDTGKRSADSEALHIPPGPNSPVGIFWCGLSRPGIGMHGTPNPETIGRARSHGCIRMANWDAVRLPTLIRPGTTVEIR